MRYTLARDPTAVCIALRDSPYDTPRYALVFLVFEVKGDMGSKNVLASQVAPESPDNARGYSGDMCPACAAGRCVTGGVPGGAQVENRRLIWQNERSASGCCGASGARARAASRAIAGWHAYGLGVTSVAFGVA